MAPPEHMADVNGVSSGNVGGGPSHGGTPPLNSLKYMADVNDGSLGRCRGGHRNGTPWAVMADMTSWQMLGDHHMVAPPGSFGCCK
jgi:hypothetical protein